MADFRSSSADQSIEAKRMFSQVLVPDVLKWIVISPKRADDELLGAPHEKKNKDKTMLNHKTNIYHARVDAEVFPILTGFKLKLLFLLAAGTLVSSASAQISATANFPDSQGWNSAQHGSTMMTGDLNNDQHADVCGRGAAGIYCALSNGTTFSAPIWATKDFSDAEGWNDPKYYGSLRLGDVNADHFADICGRAADGIYCALGKGDGTFYPATRWTTYYNDAATLGREL